MNLRRLEWYARQLSLPLSGGVGAATDRRRAVLHGRGMTFAGLREYAYGDDVRSIDWNATARFARPFVKTYQQDRAVDLLILVDCSGSLGQATNPRSKAAIARELAGLFVLVALRQEQRISLLLFTDRAELSIALHRSRRHANRLLRVLEGTEVSSRGTDLVAALREVPRLLPQPGFVLLISDFAAEHYEDDLTTASRRHEVFALALVDPDEADPPDVGLARVRDVETGRVGWVDTTSRRSRDRWRTAWQARQQLRRERLSRARATAVDIFVDRPYFATLKAACRGFATRS